MRNICLISNPHARRNRNAPGALERLHSLLGPDDLAFVSHDAGALEEAAEQCIQRGIALVGLNGGDGTNHVTISQFIRTYAAQGVDLPAFAFLRGGTMNTVSRSFSVRGTPASIVARLVRARDAGRRWMIVRRRPIRVVDGTTTRYGFIVGAGLMVNFLEEYYRHPEVSPRVAAQTLLRGLGSVAINGATARRLLHSFDADLEVGDQPWLDGTFAAFFASTQHEIGLGFRPFHRATESLDTFHALALRGPLTRIARALPAVRLGRPVNLVGFDDTTTDRLTVKAASPIGCSIDGDIYPAAQQLDLSLGPLLDLVVDADPR